ncbi:MAG TPA: NlpC/P60 family protein [Syntrophales bacterium]|jgi:cell wall-associated NlpC family hydrolase|nr:NlpC/P60 family protein [Syntrophales bacterium]HOU78275.1 NlpC/P60 family protein [Syntrophales bacterium]HPC33192.1 NlpC/P60 family protein [Syntrophales bacterium]HQG34560.1 NlpC/P60 family protein [Syntrophales bacterium]HQI36039.1 NlpC/P60 family protein [Syntrophales bacterium]
MMERRIFLWMGLSVLFFSLLFGTDGFADQQYRVKRGDSLARIAKKFGVTSQSIRNANGLKDNRIQTGKLIVIPAKDSQKLAKASKAKPQHSDRFYVVQKGDTLSGIARKSGVNVAEIKRLNHLKNNKLRNGQKLALGKTALGGERRKPGGQSRPHSEAVEEEGDDDFLTEEDPLPEKTAELEREALYSETTLGKWKDPDERSLLVKVAKGFLGAPYRLGGSSVRGLDCSAFVKKMYEFFDVNLPRTAREQAHVGMKVAKGELVEGDLVFFNTRRAFGHVGIYIGNNQFVHASSGKRDRHVRIDSLDKPYYNQRFVKAVRLKSLAEDNDI